MTSGVVRMQLQESAGDIRHGVLSCVLPDVELQQKGKYIAIGGTAVWPRWYEILTPATQCRFDPFTYENVEFHRSVTMPTNQFYIITVF